jgi:hypothetical protein
VTTALLARYNVPGLNVAFLFSFVVTAAMTLAIIPLAKRRPIGTPLSWGEAMVAAVYSFFVMFLAYGVVPHQWLNHADSELNWRADRLVVGPKLGSQHILEKLPFVLTRQVFRDIIAATIYIVFLALQVYVWVWWQKRGQAKAGAKALLSAYGRPLVRRG